MNNLTFRTHEVLAKLTTNRDSQATKLKVATQEWTAQLLYDLEETIRYIGNRQISSIDLCKLECDNKKPISYLKNYDTAIQMLGMCTDEMITLSDKEFKQYINNDWDWSASWDTSNAKYLG